MARKPAAKKTPAAKRRAEADKAAAAAVKEMGVERAFFATQGEMNASFAGITLEMHKVIGRYFRELPELTPKDVLFAHRIAVQSGQTVAALNTAPPPIEAHPLPQSGDGARVIDGQALPAQPPGMLEHLEAIERKKGLRGDA